MMGVRSLSPSRYSDPYLPNISSRGRGAALTIQIKNTKSLDILCKWLEVSIAGLSLDLMCCIIILIGNVFIRVIRIPIWRIISPIPLQIGPYPE